MRGIERINKYLRRALLNKRSEIIRKLAVLWTHYFGLLLQDGIYISITDPNEFIQKQLILNGAYEKEINNLLKLLLDSNTVFFDVGANIGVHSLFAARKANFVYSFEPVPQLVNIFRRNIRINRLSNIKVFNCALADYCHETYFYIAKRKDFGSHSLLTGVMADSITKIKVQVDIFDDFFFKYSDGRRSIVKIDVEGAESLVLKGCSRSFRAWPKPIFIFETGDRLADQLGESAKSVINKFVANEYFVFLINDTPPILTKIIDETLITSNVANYLAIHATDQKYESILRLL